MVSDINSLLRARAGSPAQQAQPAPTQAATSSVGSFTNQRLGGLLSGRPDGLSDPVSVQSPTQIALAGVNRPMNAVQASAQRRVDAVKAGNDRLSQIVAVGAANRARQSAAQGGGVSLGNIQSAGRAYQPDGRLDASRNKVLALASSYIGTPYVLGGTTTRGIDCSGLVMMVYNQLGYNITRHSATWQGNNIPGVRTSIQNLRPGDIVAWKDGSHIAIYAGNGQIIEAAGSRNAPNVIRRNIWDNYNNIYGIALRLPGE